MSDALTLALDRFDVPPPSAGLADRIIAAATVPTRAPFAPPRRDRRGMWRHGRQVLLGTMAVGLLSAGAVASGLLGKVGIEVPVLTAMLAPEPKPVAKTVHVAIRHVPVRAPVVAPPAVLVDSAPAVLLPRPLLPGERMALREARRERRQAFAAEHPVAAAVIRERVRQQLQRRALARRQALMTPGIDPSIGGTGPLDRMALARAARRDRLMAEKIVDQRIQAREAKLADPQGAGIPAPTEALPDSAEPPAQGELHPLQQRQQQLDPEVRAARRKRLQQMTPEQRTQFRAQMQQRRALRLELQRPVPGQ
ncbi:MAG: hypothetical protein ACOYLK_01635 [Sphingomonas sp.]